LSRMDFAVGVVMVMSLLGRRLVLDVQFVHGWVVAERGWRSQCSALSRAGLLARREVVAVEVGFADACWVASFCLLATLRRLEGVVGGVFAAAACPWFAVSAALAFPSSGAAWLASR